MEMSVNGGQGEAEITVDVPVPARRLVCLRSGDYLGVEGRPVEVQVDLCRLQRNDHDDR